MHLEIGSWVSNSPCGNANQPALCERPSCCQERCMPRILQKSELLKYTEMAEENHSPTCHTPYGGLEAENESNSLGANRTSRGELIGRLLDTYRRKLRVLSAALSVTFISSLDASFAQRCSINGTSYRLQKPLKIDCLEKQA